MSTRRYLPDRFTNRFETIEPVLELSPGDRLVTTTLDAHGLDRRFEKLASKDNPLTGPFSVRGAEPGDVLAVRLERLVPNRSLGWSICTIAPGVVDPDYARLLPGKTYGLWELRREAGTFGFIREIDLPEHTASGDFAGNGRRASGPGSIHVPLRPMLGCLGVAPSGGQSILSSTAGAWGGNMDYRGLAEGAAVYFPVFEKGALLFAGDGHAAQSEGELAGSGVEVSMEVTLSVDLLKNRTCRWPGGENGEFIFTIGNARPLDQAARHAATEMLRWLQEGWGMGMEQACLLLGQAAEFDLGNVFDPAYTMVCKVPKSLLPPRGGAV